MMKEEMSLQHWLTEWERYDTYLKARSKSQTLRDPERYLGEITKEHIGPLNDELRMILTYLRDIEASVWNVYFQELVRTPTGKNPVVRAFLESWKIDEDHHAKILDKVLEVGGGAWVTQRHVPWDASWIARLLGERLFGGVHMTIGAVNELMTMFGYRQIAARVQATNPALSRILLDIAHDEGYHTGFYLSGARHYLSDSRWAQWLTAFACRFATAGVGVGVRKREEAYAVFAYILQGVHEKFLKKVAEPIRKLPGQEGFGGMHALVRNVMRQASV